MAMSGHTSQTVSDGRVVVLATRAASHPIPNGDHTPARWWRIRLRPMKMRLFLMCLGLAASSAAATLDPYDRPVQALHDASARVRESAARTLANSGAHAPPAALPALIAAAHAEPSPAVRAEIARALGTVGEGHDDAVPTLARLLGGDHDAGVRKSAAQSLGWLGAPAGAQALVGALGDPSTEVREAAAAALGAKGFAPAASDAVPALTAALGDAASEVWREAAKSLAAFGAAAAPAVPALRQMLASGDSSRRRAAANALIGLGPAGAGASPECVTALDDGDAETRVEVAVALLAMQSEQALAARALVAALSFAPNTGHYEDRSWRSAVVSRAAWALGHYASHAPRAAVPRLAALVSDDDADIRRFSQPALRAVVAELVSARRADALPALQEARQVLQRGGGTSTIDAVAVDEAITALSQQGGQPMRRGDGDAAVDVDRASAAPWRAMPPEMVAAASVTLLALLLLGAAALRRVRSAAAPRVLLSYRRDDSASVCGRLYDRLVARWGADHVFRDIDSIAPGEAFAARIAESIGSCDAVVVLIGRDWLGARGDGTRRIDDPADFVRIEVAQALAQGKRVIPVLHDGARVPGPAALPAAIAALAERNALEISDGHFGADVARLIAAVLGRAQSAPAYA
jgi:HEAT repeat protein